MFQHRRKLVPRFSVTELMKRGQQSYSHLFPLIESSQYQRNAAFSLNYSQYKHIRDDDIDKYFNFMLYESDQRQCPMSPRLGRQRLSTCSLDTVMTGCMTPRHSLQSQQSCLSPTNVGENSMFGELFTKDESSSTEGTVPPFVSYGCFLEYEQSSGILQVRMVHTIGTELTFISNFLGKEKIQLFAKV